MSQSTPSNGAGSRSAGSGMEGSTDPSATQGAKSVFTDPLVLASLMAFFAFLISIPMLHVYGAAPAIKVTTFDVITSPGQPATLSAKFEQNLPGPTNPDLTDFTVRFVGTDHPSLISGALLTDHEGIARANLLAPPAGAYRYQALPKVGIAREVERSARLFVVPTERPLLICDIDDTVTDGGSWELLTQQDVVALPDAARVLTALSKRYQLVFLTARDDGILNLTRDWLQKNSFPTAPVLGRDWQIGTLSQPQHEKLSTIRKLAGQYPQIPWAIGNADSDCHAYRKAGIPHLIIGEAHCPSDSSTLCRSISDWLAVEKELEGQKP